MDARTGAATERAPSGIMGPVISLSPRSAPVPAVCRRAGAAGLVLAVGLLAGCGPMDSTPSAGAPTSEPTASAEPTTAKPTPAERPTAKPSPEPEATPADGRPTAPPQQRVAAGTVAEGRAAVIGGTGSAEVTFDRDGEFAVVVHLDCTDCAGDSVLTGPGRRSPWGAGLAGAEVAYLVDVFADSDPEQSLWLATEGDWSMRLESWNDLEQLTGEQTGSGATVLFLGDTAPAVRLQYEPADGEDKFSGRYFGVVREAARMFGDSAAMDETVDLELPGVLAISTRGSWTVTPLD